jgi:endonuclease/exonuclease/phosphatase family metal-dependent hydrolase
LSDRPAGSPVDQIRVLTLNLWGRKGKWTDRRRVLSDGLRGLSPDLIAFQEAIVDDEDQVRDLVGPGWHIAHQQARDPEGMGVSVVSRWPLGTIHELDLHLTERTDVFPCVTLAAELDAPAPLGPILFVNHFPSYQLAYEHERELQAVAAARLIEDLVARRCCHVVLAGDLDADPAATSIRFWTGRQSLDGLSVCYRDAWEGVHPGEPGHTFSPANPRHEPRDWPFLRIDYLLVRCTEEGPTLDIVACDLAFDTSVGGEWASDHFGVIADLRVPS